MEKRVIVIHGIILAKSYGQAVCQFNAFCNNNWFTKLCKSSPVPGTFKSLIGKPLQKLPEEDFREAQFVIANFKLYDTHSKNEARMRNQSLLAWKVAATREI